MTQNSIAHQYMDRINAGDAEGVAALFSEDSVFVGGNGVLLTGRPAILDFYRNSFARHRTRGDVARVVRQGNTIAFEVTVHTQPQAKHGQPNAIDVIELDKDGLIVHKVVYWPAAAQLETA